MRLAQSSTKRMKRSLAVRNIIAAVDEPWECDTQHEPEVRRMDAGANKCFKCGGKWHLARNCPSEECRACEGIGHNLSTCPARASEGGTRPRANTDRDLRTNNTA